MGDISTRSPDDYLREMLDDFLDLTDRAPANRRRVWAPAVDVKRTKKEYLLEADLPGMETSDVDLRVEADRLLLSGDKQEEKEESDEGYLRKERYSRSFHRSFRLPTDVDVDKIDAEFKNGVLKVHLPRSGKDTSGEGKQIKVKG